MTPTEAFRGQLGRRGEGLSTLIPGISRAVNSPDVICVWLHEASPLTHHDSQDVEAKLNNFMGQCQWTTPCMSRARLGNPRRPGLLCVPYIRRGMLAAAEMEVVENGVKRVGNLGDA